MDSTALHKNSVNLKEIYPISPLLLLKDLTPLLSFLIGLLLLNFFIPTWFNFSGSTDSYLKTIDPSADPSYYNFDVSSDIGLLTKRISSLVFFWIITKAIYLKLKEIFLIYKLENNTLMVRKGILRRDTLVQPIDKLTEVYVDRSWLDWLFGIATLVFYAPAIHPNNGIRIKGLSHRNALKFETYILLTNEISVFGNFVWVQYGSQRRPRYNIC